MKMGAAPYRAVNGLFSVGVEAIFIAADFIRLGGLALTLSAFVVVPQFEFSGGLSGNFDIKPPRNE